MPKIVRTSFKGSSGNELAGRLDMPTGVVRAYALFAHCFTCSKDLKAVRRIAGELSAHGIAVLRFDFTGLGSSEGEFANTDFSSNVEDIVLAAAHLKAGFGPPALLIGHSLGGAAVLAAAERIPEARAVVTIGAPADVAHVLGNFGASLADIERDGKADVTLAGRSFRITRQFIEDARGQRMLDHIAGLRRPLLILHAPLDQQVGIDNASRIFLAAKHPKSFISLDDADHLLTRQSDAAYAARVIAAWASRYLPEPQSATLEDAEAVVVTETGAGRYENVVESGRHRLTADEPAAVGGGDAGPSPYDYLSIALGACTSMTLRIYAEHKKLDLGRISVAVTHGKVAAEHCLDCGAVAQGREGRIDRFERVISIIDGPPPDPALRDKLVEIAGKCPVHRTLEHGSAIVTRIADG
jgi:uncharacterized OsmC-like protein/alpha-beta hydrolase superfamily lysophospholipase